MGAEMEYGDVVNVNLLAPFILKYSNFARKFVRIPVVVGRS
jgi:hypothetical protein